MEPMAYSSDVNINSFAIEIMEREKKKVKIKDFLYKFSLHVIVYLSHWHEGKKFDMDPYMLSNHHLW